MRVSGPARLQPLRPPADLTVGPPAPLAAGTVLIGMTRRAAWAALLWANGGLAPGKIWPAVGGRLRVRLVPGSAEEVARDFAAGRTHLVAASLDQLVLWSRRLRPRRHPGARPRALMLLAYGRGGDGLVVRGGIRSVNQLGRGRTVVLQPDSPSHYLLLNALAHADVPLVGGPRLLYAPSPAHAAAAFLADPTLDACVCRGPELWYLRRQEGLKLLLSTRTASRLLAGVLAARTDFTATHPGLLAGLVRGVLAAAEELRAAGSLDPAAPRAARLAPLLAAALGVTPREALDRLDDSSLCAAQENRAFFLDETHPAGFRVLWQDADALYRRVGRLQAPLDPGEVQHLAPLTAALAPQQVHTKNPTTE